MLNKQEILETLTHSLSLVEQGNIEQHQSVLVGYESCCKKDRCACFTMLSSMHNDLIGEFEGFSITHDMWKAPELRYGRTSTIRLRRLAMKFDSYKMSSNHMIK